MGSSSSSSSKDSIYNPDTNAQWEYASKEDENGYAEKITHVEVTMTGGGASDFFGVTHELLVFDVRCGDGSMTKFSAELYDTGVNTRSGHHKKIIRVVNTAKINMAMTRVRNLLATSKSYSLFGYNCKHYAWEKFCQFL